MTESQQSSLASGTTSDDAPELADAFFLQAKEYIGAKLVRRGHPTAENSERALTVRGESETDWGKVRVQTLYVWDGEDESERPLTFEEMQAGIEAAKMNAEELFGAFLDINAAVYRDRSDRE